MRYSTLSHGPHENVDTLCLPSTAWPKHHHSMTHTLCLKQLDELEGPGGMVDEAGLLHLVVNGCLDLRIASLVQHDAWEEVIDETYEERLILIHQLGQVHVPQDSHDNCALAVCWASPLHAAQGAQHREDVAETKVIMHLMQEDMLT